MITYMCQKLFLLSIWFVHLFGRWKGSSMKIWRVTSNNPMKVVALPDLGVYLQPSQSFDVPEDRAVFSKDLQEALRTSTVSREVMDTPREVRPLGSPHHLPPKPSMKPTRVVVPEPAKDDTDLVCAMRENNLLLTQILTVLKERPLPAVTYATAADPNNPTSQPQTDTPVFIPTFQKTKAEMGGSLETEAKVTASDKAKNARDALKQFKGKG